VNEIIEQPKTVERSGQAPFAGPLGSASGMDLKPLRYVLGFLFRDNCTSVALIRKDKPKRQAGLLNGIGGKIEDGETELEAMVREFREETGVDTSESGWRQYCEMSGDAFTVYCFVARDSDAWEKAATETSETVEKHHPDLLSEQDCVSNLRWLVELALDENYGKDIYATVRYSRPFRMQNTELTDRRGAGSVK